MNLKELREKLEGLLKAARAICELAEQETRDFTAEERQKVANLLEEAGKVKAEIKTAEGDQAMRDQLAALGVGLAGDRQAGSGIVVPQTRGATIGEQFMQAKAIQDWLAAVAPGGQIPEGARGLVSPPVMFKDMGLFGRKDVVTGESDVSAGAFVETDYTGIYEPLGRIPLTLRGMISVRQTTSDLVSFVRQTTAISQAAPVAEANVTEYAGATGEVSGEKPEGVLAWEAVTAPVRTIAVWIPATKRALSDASQIRGIIDQELRADLNEELESQILNGTGVGENFTGILNTAGILTQAFNTDILTTTRQAITTIQVTGRATPTGWLINPQDWETVELLQDANNRYYWGGPLTQGSPRLWGVPVVENQTQTQGTALLGDFRKAVLWDRERYSLQVSDSHEDFFIRNMVAFLGEIRAAFGVIRPSAFVEVDLESGS